MEIIPALYIYRGRCVAFYKSHSEQKEVYPKSPLNYGREFERQGAQRLYVVELDGKATNEFQQQTFIRELTNALKIPVYLEAGFKTIEEIDKGFESGATFIVLRSPQEAIVRTAIKKYGAEKIVVQIQAKGPNLIQVLPENMKKNGSQSFEKDIVDYAENLMAWGVQSIVYKDERSEGTLIHPNYDEVDRLCLITGSNSKIYVAGGIGDVKHLKLLQKIGAAGAIIGKALYEGLLTLHEAKEAVR